MMVRRFGNPVNQETSPACMINKATDQTGGNELITTPNQMSRNATRGRTREITSQQMITKRIKPNLKRIAPFSPQASMTSLATGFTSSPPSRRINHVSMMSRLLTKMSQTYNSGKRISGRSRSPGLEVADEREVIDARPDACSRAA